MEVFLSTKKSFTKAADRKLKEGEFILGKKGVNFPVVNVISHLGDSSKKAYGKFFIGRNVKIRFAYLLKPNLDSFYRIILIGFRQYCYPGGTACRTVCSLPSFILVIAFPCALAS